jgi:LPXTG-site transpeptidase (sortase) family protein
MLNRNSSRRAGLVTRALLAVAVLGGALATAVGPAPAGAAVTSYYVEQTGHVFADPFLSHWVKTSGMQRYGLPVTDRIERSDRWLQYFEYALLVSRDNDRQRASEVPVGRNLLAVQHNPERTVAGKRIGGSRTGSAYVPIDDPAKEDVLYDAETRHSIRGMIKGPYEQMGGAERFGSPLSEAFTAEGSRQQWFEFGRVVVVLPERTPKAAPVGAELANAYGANTKPSKRGSLPLFDAGRFRIYSGDGTIPDAPGPFTPVGILIPAIGVDAFIEQIGITNGAMDTPSDAWNVGWYPVLSYPGEQTNVVMSGHRDWWGIGPTVFWDLDKLGAGDRIYLIGADGLGASYAVTESYMVDAGVNANDVIGDVGFEVLTLITCDGAFDGSEYLARRIVRAERF